MCRRGYKPWVMNICWQAKIKMYFWSLKPPFDVRCPSFCLTLFLIPQLLQKHYLYAQIRMLNVCTRFRMVLMRFVPLVIATWTKWVRMWSQTVTVTKVKVKEKEKVLKAKVKARVKVKVQQYDSQVVGKMFRGSLNTKVWWATWLWMIRVWGPCPPFQALLSWTSLISKIWVLCRTSLGKTINLSKYLSNNMIFFIMKTHLLWLHFYTT